MNVPEELAALPQWVCWKLTTRRGKTTKVPHRPSDGALASSTDPEDWGTLQDALAGIRRHRLDGVGFVFTADDPYAGVDLDHCVLEDGSIHPAAQAMIDTLNSYTELSPSGTGVHVILRAEVGRGVRTPETEWGGNFEAYDRGRYFTFTGQPLGDQRIREGAISIELSNPNDDRIIDRLSRRTQEFRDLFDDGDTSAYDEDHSRADLALANMIAARTDDPEQIERIMRRSGLVREKWDHPDTESTWLMRRVIEPAIRDKKKTGTSGDFETDVASRLYFIEVNEEAKARYEARNVQDLSSLLPPTGWTLADDLALDLPSPPYTIGSLQVLGHNVLLVAKYKLGKTTLTMNLARALSDGTPFLSIFPVDFPEGRIAVWNYELLPSQWNDWMRRMDIEHPERLVPAHFRGKGIIPIWIKAVQAQVIEWMRANEVRYWIIDPTMKAWSGLLQSEGDNMAAGRFLDAVDEIKESAGIHCTLLSHHTGRAEDAQERARGATRLEDWMDTGWYLTGVKDQIDLHAFGRDVELEKIRITYSEEDQRTFTTEGEESQEATQRSGAHKFIEQCAKMEDEGVALEQRTTTAILTALKGKQDEKRAWAQEAVNSLWLKREKGKGNALYCTVTKMGRRELETGGE